MTRHDVILIGGSLLAGTFAAALVVYAGVNRLLYGRWLP